MAQTILNGVPGTAMPANALTGAEIADIVAYLRTLQQAAPAATGDRNQGETLYFGAARCSSCHIVNGRGGLLGPELPYVGSARPRGYLIDRLALNLSVMAALAGAVRGAAGEPSRADANSLKPALVIDRQPNQ